MRITCPACDREFNGEGDAFRAHVLTHCLSISPQVKQLASPNKKKKLKELREIVVRLLEAENQSTPLKSPASKNNSDEFPCAANAIPEDRSTKIPSAQVESSHATMKIRQSYQRGFLYCVDMKSYLEIVFRATPLNHFEIDLTSNPEAILAFSQFTYKLSELYVFKILAPYRIHKYNHKMGGECFNIPCGLAIKACNLAIELTEFEKVKFDLTIGTANSKQIDLDRKLFDDNDSSDENDEFSGNDK